jgi:hypothetical protein
MTLRRRRRYPRGAAVVLQDDQSVVSLDASVPMDDGSYFAGATTVEDVVASLR